ncbi:MAG TPA: M20/M25/M40 family metallo-hydrolase, partial [Clostridia bacterium]|nr:M20/M25/M40 family metallo-hydrolase [Clostridia bacterium]
DSIGLEYNGKAVGAGCEDAESGPLTLNLGIVRCDGAKAESVIDIRYPVTKNGGEIAGPILEHAKTHGIEAAVKSDSKPLMVDPDSELIEKLRSAYKTATKEEPRLYSTGGGSYARSLENRGVAFGAGVRPCSFYNIHGADEFLDIEDFMKHCQICLQAMYELGCC